VRRQRSVKIVATLGPASSEAATIKELFDEGVDVFRLNMSHGTQDEQRARYDIIRKVEADTKRPICVLGDLQGPKLRVGTFSSGSEELIEGAAFRMDLDTKEGDGSRVCLIPMRIQRLLSAGRSRIAKA